MARMSSLAQAAADGGELRLLRLRVPGPPGPMPAPSGRSAGPPAAPPKAMAATGLKW